MAVTAYQNDQVRPFENGSALVSWTHIWVKLLKYNSSELLLLPHFSRIFSFALKHVFADHTAENRQQPFCKRLPRCRKWPTRKEASSSLSNRKCDIKIINIHPSFLIMRLSSSACFLLNYCQYFGGCHSCNFQKFQNFSLHFSIKVWFISTCFPSAFTSGNSLVLHIPLKWCESQIWALLKITRTPELQVKTPSLSFLLNQTYCTFFCWIIWSFWWKWERRRKDSHRNQNWASNSSI